MASPQPVTPLQRPRDGAMDRRIARRRFTWPRVAAGVAALVVAGWLVQQLVQTSGVRSFAIASELVTVSTARSGVFLDFIPIRGSVQPLRTVYLDAIEGGRVEAVFVDEGRFVERDEPLLELSNTALQLDVISREAQVSEQLNNLRNTRLAMEQNRLALRSTLVETDFQITRLTRLVERRAELFERHLISRQDYDEVLDELEYFHRRREVTVDSQEADERMRLAQVESLEQSIEQLERNLEIARANLDNLVIKAPMSGQLTSLDAEIGESKARGQRLGQIDDVDDFKVTAFVDEFYVTRAQTGLLAEFELAGRTHALEVIQVYPQIRDGQFQIDLAFVDGPPANLRRGQTLQIRLALGDSAEALLLPRGGFFQDTGGNWAFVLDASGSFAEKRTLRLGRRNPEYFEVLDGLAEGDRVITSSYTSYADMDRIVLRD
jgi:HlyD family secretion protein